MPESIKLGPKYDKEYRKEFNLEIFEQLLSGINRSGTGNVKSKSKKFNLEELELFYIKIT